VGRVDYWRDPRAPRPNSLVVAASAVVTDGQGRIAVHKRVDNDLWALPGGQAELGESLRETVLREVREETGLAVEVEYVIAVYSDPEHVFAYDDGEVRQEFSVCVKCQATGGTLEVSSESHEVRWCAPGELENLPMHPRIRARIVDYLAGEKAALNP
jgi:8-oxo-dGTP pyrophosphatase MutT (NUDIX family)